MRRAQALHPTSLSSRGICPGICPGLNFQTLCYEERRWRTKPDTARCLFSRRARSAASKKEPCGSLSHERGSGPELRQNPARPPSPRKRPGLHDPRAVRCAPRIAERIAALSDFSGRFESASLRAPRSTLHTSPPPLSVRNAPPPPPQPGSPRAAASKTNLVDPRAKAPGCPTPRQQEARRLERRKSAEATYAYGESAKKWSAWAYARENALTG